MKLKTLLLLSFLSIFFLVGCSEEVVSQEERIQKAQIEAEMQRESMILQHEKEMLRLQIELEKAKNMSGMVIQKEVIQNNNQSIAAEERQAESLEYLETSQQVRDGLEAASIGLSILGVLFE